MKMRLLQALALLCFAGGCQAENRVVLYCAQDREFAEQILADFEQTSALKVATRYDSEASKSVGLFDVLILEAPKPRCDVHWNNEIIATIRLQRKGILEPYDSPAAKDFPAEYRAKDKTWTAFATRARVLILNTELLKKHGIAEADWPKSLNDLTHERWKKHFALAKPVAGTSATQVACLFEAWGSDKAKAWYRALKANEMQLVLGNKQVAEGVGQGQYMVGLTDTDDAAEELAAGHPVRIIFPDRDAPADSKQGTLFIPNTLAIIKGCPNSGAARQLLDYLLSPEVETKLAESASRQIPLNPKAQPKLPDWMATSATAR
ncbi:MAG TPA: extracellular solute-binding protein, partial [Gemmataceae bacterium]|nr:extracellular solute-binding protein [Gemmataceae bacterium]